MKNKLNHLKHIEVFGIDVDNFYCVSISQNSITLQGKYSASLVRDLNEFFKFSTCEVNGFLEATAVLDNQQVNIVLT